MQVSCRLYVDFYCSAKATPFTNNTRTAITTTAVVLVRRICVHTDLLLLCFLALLATANFLSSHLFSKIKIPNSNRRLCRAAASAAVRTGYYGYIARLLCLGESTT